MQSGYRARITPSGYVYILITVVLGVGAVNTGNNLLYLTSSLLLALMLVSGMSSIGNLLFLKISLIPPGEIFARTPARFTLVLDRKRGRSFFLRAETGYGDARIVSVKGRIEVPLWLTFPERGEEKVGNLGIYSGFPLGFFLRSRTFRMDGGLLVYPRPLAGTLPRLTGGARGWAKSGTPQGELSDEIRELRNYRASDPLRWIDWKATARRGETVVRDFYRLQGDRMIIDLSGGTGKDRERRISEACHLVLEGDRMGWSTGLRLPDRDIPPGSGEKHRKAILEALSRA